MDIVARLSAEMTQLINLNAHLLSSGDTISVKDVESRKELINTLNDLKTEIGKVTAQIESALTQAKACHEKDLGTVDEILLKLNGSAVSATPWTKVVRRKTRIMTTAKPTIPPISDQNSPNDPTNSVGTTKIKFSEALSLAAVRVLVFEQVKQDGELYYVESADHFAFKIGGVLMHGNIGTIYTDEKNPQKIKNCKFEESCTKQDKCDYYHDPIKFPGSKDHRNFIASSWLYTPPAQYKSRPRSRRFGSREYLDADLAGMQDEEISRFHDQTMHDLLCSLLISHAYSRGQN